MALIRGRHGRPAYEPSMMVALLMYAYARGNRSARCIERACVEDVAGLIFGSAEGHGSALPAAVDDRCIPAQRATVVLA
jgi:hypothetical protein